MIPIRFLYTLFFVSLLSLPVLAQRKPGQKPKPVVAPSGKGTVAKLVRMPLGEKASVLLPSDFTPVADNNVARKTQMARKPIGYYTSPNGQVDFSAAQRPSQFPEKDVELVRQFYRANLMRNYSKIDFIQDKIETINKQPFIVFEFVSTFEDESGAAKKAPPIKKYTYLMYHLEKEFITIFTFNAPIIQQEMWQPVASKVMHSIKL
jgi:hypothetical protein